MFFAVGSGVELYSGGIGYGGVGYGRGGVSAGGVNSNDDYFGCVCSK